jgi:hypothetical protein
VRPDDVRRENMESAGRLKPAALASAAGLGPGPSRESRNPIFRYGRRRLSTPVGLLAFERGIAAVHGWRHRKMPRGCGNFCPSTTFVHINGRERHSGRPLHEQRADVMM